MEDSALCLLSFVNDGGFIYAVRKDEKEDFVDNYDCD